MLWMLSIRKMSWMFSVRYNFMNVVRVRKFNGFDNFELCFECGHLEIYCEFYHLKSSRG